MLAALAGCASFEDPTIALDLRVLAIETTPPEQVLDVDPANPPTIDELLLQLQPIRVRALITEPNFNAELVWTMTACILEERGGRCDPEQLSFEFAGGLLQDPEVFPLGAPCKDQNKEIGNTACGLLVPDNRLVQMLVAALDADPTAGLGGVDIGISLRVRDNYITPPAEAFAEKRIRFVARIPADRRPNNNPNIDQLLLGRGGFGAEFQKSHCSDLGQVNTVNPGESVTLFPVSRESDKEEYVLPTLERRQRALPGISDLPVDRDARLVRRRDHGWTARRVRKREARRDRVESTRRHERNVRHGVGDPARFAFGRAVETGMPQG